MSASERGPTNALQRVEVFLDGATSPTQVLRNPPYRVDLDTSGLADGPHELRIVQVFEDDTRSERVVPFVTENHPPLRLEGLAPGDVVRGHLGVDLVPAPAAPAPPAGEVAPPPQREADTGLSVWWYPIAAAILFGGIWLFFLLVPSYSLIMAAGDGAGESTQATAEVDAEVMAAGEELFEATCASCHQQDGSGMGESIPALAGNETLSEVDATLTRITENAAHPAAVTEYSTDELASVATYVRNAWSNDFGPVTAEEASTYVGPGEPADEGS